MAEKPKGRLWLKILGGILIFLGILLLIAPTPEDSSSGDATGGIIIIILIGAVLYWRGTKQAKPAHLLEEAQKKIEELTRQIATLEPYQVIVDAKAEAERLEQAARQQVVDAEADAEHLKQTAQQQAADIIEQAKNEARKNAADYITAAQKSMTEANDKLAEVKRNEQAARQQAAEIVEQARNEARKIAGEALEARDKAADFEKAARAFKNIIEGYGDEYLIPQHFFIDDLADGFAHTEAGQKLKEARKRSGDMIKVSQASVCDYVETNRRDTAVAFVIDAFNGKVESALAKVRHDNAGKLQQAIKDAFAQVNINGRAFRNARITQEYLEARLDELKWAVVVQELREKDREEQRQLRERMREEEKARREYEKAMKESQAEEARLQAALEKANQAVLQANEEQKAKYEAQIQELMAKLSTVEERARALSMAQQTRAGHIYIISNIGSFGDDVLKIGMTRRLEPLDRVKELGDASVPFFFDIHAMIYSLDAPKLENELHRRFNLERVNKVNFRKEFFKVSLTEIKAALAELNIETQFTMAAEAREYRETLAIEKLPEAERLARLNVLLRQEESAPVSFESEDEAAQG